MRRFLLVWRHPSGTPLNTMLALVHESGKARYKFVDLVQDTILGETFETPSDALDWLDEWADEVNGFWQPMEKN